MRFSKPYSLGASVAAVALLSSGLASAAPSDPPSGSFYSLTGQPINSDYSQFTTAFTASSAETVFTIALRDAPATLFLDDVSITADGGANILVNGGFEQGAGSDLHQNAPLGWTYSNPLAAQGGGVVANYQPHTGAYHYADSAVAHYDMISQTLATNPGQTYAVSFFAAETSGAPQYGEFINLYLYDSPAGPAVPEPSSWALMGLGIAALGGAARWGRRARLGSARAA